MRYLSGLVVWVCIVFAATTALAGEPVESSPEGGFAEEPGEETAEAVSQPEREEIRYLLRRPDFYGELTLVDREDGSRYAGGDIYRTLGSEELAARFDRTRRRYRFYRSGGVLGIAAGGALFVTGLVVVLTSLESTGASFHSEPRRRRAGLLISTGGVGLAVVSLVLAIRGVTGDPHPVDRRELNDMVRQANERHQELRRTPPDEEARLQFRLAPFVDASRHRRAGLAVEIRW